MKHMLVEEEWQDKTLKPLHLTTVVSMMSKTVMSDQLCAG